MPELLLIVEEFIINKKSFSKIQFEYSREHFEKRGNQLTDKIIKETLAKMPNNNQNN